MAIFDKIGEFAKSASGKAEDKIETLRLNGKIRTEQQTIQGYKAELGARYWEKIAAGEVEPDAGVTGLVDKIKASLAVIADTEAEIKKIEEERAAAEAAAKAAAEEAARAAAEAKAAASVATAAATVAAAAVSPVEPVQAQQAAPTSFEAATPVQGEYHFGAPSAPAAPAAPAAPVQDAPAAEERKCANCGVALAPGTRFCQECGTPAPVAAPQKRFCANCGKELAPAVRFCPECGAKA